MRYILLLSSINFGTEISKRLLLRGPGGHWGSRHYTVRLFILCGYIFSEYVMKRKNSINQPNATSVTFLLIMQGFWAHTYYDVLKTLQDSKTALISQFWSVMVLSVGSLMPSVMQSHMGFIVTLFMMSLDKSCSQLRVSKLSLLFMPGQLKKKIVIKSRKCNLCNFMQVI